MNYGFVRSPTVIISDCKDLCAEALGLDIFVDDKWENCVSVRERTHCDVRVFDRPWNHGRQMDGIRRIRMIRERYGYFGSPALQ